MTHSAFHNLPRRPDPDQPRKVRGGIRLSADQDAAVRSWAAQRWMRLVEQAAPGQSLVDGLAYAMEGQTRGISTVPGRIAGAVQGRAPRAYDTQIILPVLTHESSERLIAVMVDQPALAAKLLAGELPANIEEVFTPLGLRLFPAPDGEDGSIRTSCTCTKGLQWCKHACCLALLVAERLAADPFLMFTLRGLPREDLIDRIRQRRLVAGSGFGSALVYTPLVPGVSGVTVPPLEELIDRFWQAGPELEEIDAPIAPPEVTHPLLRRLGPSPFAGGAGGRFPLVGLLATCYELISEATLRRAEGAPEVPPELPGAEGPDAPH